MKAVAIIPVRLESTRLHEKAIADICGLPMFVHTYKRAKLAKTLDEVYLATDSSHIAEIADKYDVNVIMTSTEHKNSTERIAEACENIDCDIVVNIQGDEPLLFPDHIDKITKPMINDSSIQVTIGISHYTKQGDTSNIKAVLDLNNNILFCSRNDIPINYKSSENNYWRLVFIVPHRKKWIRKYLEWEPTPLELLEDNHFLRLLEHGIKIKAIEVSDAHISVDTQKDLDLVNELMKKDLLKNQYSK